MKGRFALIGLLIAGLLAAFWDPLVGSEAQSAFDSGFSQVMHYSTNRLFVWSQFLPAFWQSQLVFLAVLIAGALIYRGRMLDRALAGFAVLSVFLGLVGGDAVAMSSAAGFLLFAAARSSLFLNAVGLIIAPQLAIISRSFAAAVSNAPAAGIMLLVLSVSFGISLFAPDLKYPEYPLLGHVVPTFGVLFHEAARIGFAAPIDFGNLMVEQSAIALSAVLLIIAGLWGVVRTESNQRKVLLGLGLLGLVDALLPGSLIYLSPLRAIFRLLPTLSELPLSAVFLGVSSGLLCFVALREPSHRVKGLVVIWLGMQWLLPDPLLNGTKREGFFALPRSEIIEDFAKQGAQNGIKKIIDSPSLYPAFLRRRFSRADTAGCLQKASIAAFEHEISASSNSDQLVNLYDGKRDTRWSASRGKQLGDEWLAVRFNDGAEELLGMQLMTGEFLTDFARGLSVYYLESCGAPVGAADGMIQLFNENEWQGELAFTSDGFPYFKEERYTQLLFPHPIKAQCLLLKQVGRSDSYDWSVTDLRIIQISSHKPGVSGECESDQH